MILLSSIVKANLLYDAPKSVDYSKMKSENSSQELDKNKGYERNEKNEFILKQAIKKAQHIEAEATNRANSIIETAIINSQNILSDAEKKGYEEGYLRGLVAGAEANEKLAEEGLLEIRELVQLMKTEQKASLKTQEKDLIRISFEIAKKIMKQHVHLEENSIPKMLEEIIQENEDGVKIYLSEYQKTLDLNLDKSMAKKIRSISKDAKVVLVKDLDVIMIETENGIVDMSVPQQLKLLKEAVENAKE